MQKDDLNLMCCPACGAKLTLASSAPQEPLPGFDAERLAWEGSFECAGCHAKYPLINGVACLGKLDASWLMPLREAESRICLTMRTLEEQVWEAGREALLTEQGHHAKGIGKKQIPRLYYS